MWYSGEWLLTTCPVLDVHAPRVESVLGWFRRTHELVPTFAGAVWQLARLPHAGGVADQENWLMEALAAVCAELNVQLAEARQDPVSDTAEDALVD